MRASLVLVAIVALSGPRLSCLAQPAPSDPTPVFDVGVSVVPTRFLPVQLVGRPTSRTFSCAASVNEAGSSRYNSTLSLVIAPGSSERKAVEVGSYSFRFTATAAPTADRVDTEVIVSMGSRVISRYRGTTSFPALSQPEETTVPAQ